MISIKMEIQSRTALHIPIKLLLSYADLRTTFHWFIRAIVDKISSDLCFKGETSVNKRI